MPLKYTQVEGRPVGLYLALLASGVSTEPSDVTVTVDTAGASEGANVIPITDPGTDIPKNTVLTFDDSTSVKVVVTEDFASGSAGDLSVEAFDGADGDGISAALSSGDAAAWDQLYTVVGTEDSPFTNNAQTQDLQAVVYGSSSAINVGTPQVQSIAPQIQRSGLFLAEGQLVQDIIQYADTNRNWWAKHVIPDSDGAAWLQREGLCRVTDLNQAAPANDLIRLSFTIRFVSAVPTTTFPGVA